MPLKLDKVVFLDRDGVINKDSSEYIKSWAEFEFIPGSLNALQRLTEAGFSIILVTNQSAVNRGLMSTEALEYLFSKLKMTVEHYGGHITDNFYCPHLPEDQCACRKPLPGMIQQACRRYDLDVAAACMIGDNVKDIECAKAAGCGCSILVRTGSGAEAETKLKARGPAPSFVADDLLEAALWLINSRDADPAA
jgi:D-glycero-D-manno-heptose 1,7-bisphosphate phosphatase